MAHSKSHSEPELRAFEQKLEELSAGSARTAVWLRPVLTAVGELGGEASPIEVERWLRTNYANTLRPQQWAHAIRAKYVRWARNELRKLGALAGETGRWALTEVGQRYWKKHRHEPLEASTDWPELSDEETGDPDAPPVTVEVTRPDGYEIPLLRHLARGVQTKSAMIEHIGQELRDQLLPGDLRLVPQGITVLDERARWALTHLGQKEQAKKAGHGSWEITDTGRARLAKESRSWSLAAFRGSKTKVRAMMTPIPSNTTSQMDSRQESDPLPPSVPLVTMRPADDERAREPSTPVAPRTPRKPWDSGRWLASKSLLGANIFDVVHDRLRPDLGPSPAAPLVRNLIFNGPPGTGKSRAAELVATALTGEGPSDDGGHRLLQFHPSYSYEDFVQGLRPELGGSSLRYHIQAGPFLQVCRAAAEDRQRFHVIIVDEINRGEPSRIFGEALFGLEKRDRSISMLGGGSLVVPPNLVVLGTMNSVDRSIALMDIALRRRFGFVYLAPDFACVRERWPKARQIDGIIDAVVELNRWLGDQLSAEHVIGQSFFLNAAHPLDTRGSLQRVWTLDIAPLLEEYLFHDRDRLREIHALWKQWTSRFD